MCSQNDGQRQSCFESRHLMTLDVRLLALIENVCRTLRVSENVLDEIFPGERKNIETISRRIVPRHVIVQKKGHEFSSHR